MTDFFISHSSNDKITVVDSIVNKLQNMGYSVWYDKNDILIGEKIQEAIKKGLDNSYCLILVITNNFFKSKWTFYETGLFHSNKTNRIIPLFYDVSSKNKNDILSIIGNVKYIDINKGANSKEDFSVSLIKALEQIKRENTDLQVIEKLYVIQKQLASYETVNSEILSLKLKEYLCLLEDKNEFVILSAKKIVKIAILDLIKSSQKTPKTPEDSEEALFLLEQNNIGSKNFREYVEFILNQDSEKFVYEYLSVTNHALSNILTYYMNQKYQNNFSFSQIKVVFPNELKYNDFIDMFEIDKKVMREDLIANTETTYAWFKHNKYTHIGVRDLASKKIVGYFSVLPISNDTYSKIINGNFEDKDFTPDCIEQYIFPDFYRIYVAGVGIDPLFQNTGAFIKLYNALIDLFLFFAKEREIYISEVLAEASTKQGEKFCKMVGMKKITSTNNQTDVYRLVTIPPEFRLRNSKGKELYEICQKKFEEYRDCFDKSYL